MDFKPNHIVVDGKKYLELDLYAGCSLDTAVNTLFECNGKYDLPVCANFNGHMLYSDSVTMDSAYLECVGCTKEEFAENQRKLLEEYERHKQEHEAAIPELTKTWIIKGHEVLDKKYWEDWDRIVPIRLSDLYEGMELGHTLEIVEHLNSGGLLKTAKTILVNQGHSGMSASLVVDVVSKFCDRGTEFMNYIRNMVSA